MTSNQLRLRSVPHLVTESPATSAPEQHARTSTREAFLTGEVVDVGIGDDILVVDDSPANLVAIEAALAPLGRTVVCVGSGVDALARLLDQDFALVLLDVAMPGITGIETARLIRSRERSRGTPIIFVTGMHWHDEAVDEAYAAGGFDFLIKPVRPEVLRAKAQVFLKLQERTRALWRQAEELRASQARLYEHELHAQRQRFESELLDTRLQQLAEGDRRQHELAGKIGSELLHPLQTLQAAFDLLRAHPNADKGERVYALVEHRLVHATRLVEILIDVARVASGELALVPGTVDLAELVREAIDECRPLVEARKLAIRHDAGGGALPVMADRARLRQAFAILIDHTLRSSPEGGAVLIIARAAAGDAVVCISDAGGELAPELLPRSFEMFVADNSSRGLGLTLARRLVELHDGAVRASTPCVGKAAAFEVLLPLAPQDVELASLDVFAAADPEQAAIDAFAETTVRMSALDRAP